MVRRPLVLVLGLCCAALAPLGACGSTVKEGKALQPNPLAMPAGEASYVSRKIHIRVRDMEIPRAFRMYNSAWFSVVSRDRLRFHVVLVHKWEEFADVRNWNVFLEDDQGHVYRPEAKEKGINKFTTKVWDYERRSSVRNIFGDVVGTRNDGYRQRVNLDKVDVFKGQGDVTFYAANLIDPKVRRLTLVVERGGLEYRFTWSLYDPKGGDVTDDSGSPEPESIDIEDSGGTLSPYSAPNGTIPYGSPGTGR
jgi:hypothetical protein